MSLERTQLRKLLRFLSLPGKRLEGQLKKDIREGGRRGGAGGDFHVPFWRSVKDCIGNLEDLDAHIQANIEDNDKRKRLYPLLRDGFLGWAREKSRLTNLPVTLMGLSVHGHSTIGRLPNEVAVGNLLSIDIGGVARRHIYPYFDEKCPLSRDHARLGLWLMAEALPHVPRDDLRILDVLRARSYSIEELSFRGNEEAILEAAYQALLTHRQRLVDV